MVVSKLSSVPTRLPRVVFYLSEDLKQDLEKLANARRRSVSNLLLVLAEEAVKKAKAEGEID